MDCSTGQKQVTVLEDLLYIDEQFKSLPVHCDVSYFVAKYKVSLHFSSACDKS